MRRLKDQKIRRLEDKNFRRLEDQKIRKLELTVSLTGSGGGKNSQDVVFILEQSV